MLRHAVGQHMIIIQQEFRINISVANLLGCYNNSEVPVRPFQCFSVFTKQIEIAVIELLNFLSVSSSCNTINLTVLLVVQRVRVKESSWSCHPLVKVNGSNQAVSMYVLLLRKKKHFILRNLHLYSLEFLKYCMQQAVIVRSHPILVNIFIESGLGFISVEQN